MKIARSNPRDPGATALLQASHALMESLFPPEDNHYLSVDALCLPGVHFFTASEAGQTLGCGALKAMGDYGEIKSMFTAETGRGKGIASAILTRLEAEARALGLHALKLETGNSLHAAHRLYARHGFETCAKFGDYPDSPSSLFMSKQL